jgi:hypothetical protein
MRLLHDCVILNLLMGLLHDSVDTAICNCYGVVALATSRSVDDDGWLVLVYLFLALVRFVNQTNIVFFFCGIVRKSIEM